MKIIHSSFGSGKGIYAKAKPVDRSNWREAKRIGKEMVAWLDDMQGRFLGNYHNAWAISHAQVAEEPIAMFVISAEFIAKDNGKTNHVNTLWNKRVMFNPQILEKPEFFEVQVPKRDVKRMDGGKIEVTTTLETVKKPNLYTPGIKEACMSFPYRTGKYVKRYYRIKVAYDVVGILGMRRHVKEWIEGVKAHIFQHEMEHQQAVNMVHGK